MATPHVSFIQKHIILSMSQNSKTGGTILLGVDASLLGPNWMLDIGFLPGRVVVDQDGHVREILSKTRCQPDEDPRESNLSTRNASIGL